MARTTRFPNLSEFRARASRLGHRTGASEPDVPHPTTSIGVGVPWLWVVVALLATSALGWLVLRPGDTGDHRTRFAGSTAELEPIITGSIDRSPETQQTRLSDPIDVERRIAELERAIRQRGTDPGMIGDIESRLSALEGTITTGGRAPGTRGFTGSSRERSPERFVDPAVSPLPPSLQTRRSGSQGRLLLPDGAAFGSRPEAPEFTASTTPTARSEAVPASGGRSLAPARTREVEGLQFGLDLGGFRTVDALEDSWARLAVVFPDILGDLEPRKVTRVESNGTHSYRLIAGPYGAVSDSVHACDLLRQRGVACTQAVHVGERFSR